jgi:outer membrane receptor protein involved in Fe transport
MSISLESGGLFPSQRRALAVAVSAAVTGTATAQEPYIEEVFVTATKREASLQDIPVSVTAFGTEEIEKRGFDSFQDYAKYVPGLSFGKREPGGTSIVFRGVASSGLQYGARASSCVYLDEQPITASGRNPDPRLVDVERLEALRGPQGTLYGDSCQSGTLRIITNKPDPTEFDSWIEGTGSLVDGGDAGYDFSGMVNFPLGENFAIRLTGFRAEEAGFIDNVLSPSPGGTYDNSAFTGDDVNDATYTGGRAAASWTPTDSIVVDASAMFQETDLDGFGDMTLDSVAGDLEQVRFNNEEQNDQWYQLGLTITADTGWGELVVTGAYFNRDTKYDSDAVDYQHFNFQEVPDRTVNPLIYDFGGDVPNGFAFNDQDTESWTIETRLTTPADSSSRWQGLVGFFYNHTDNFTFFQSGNDSLLDPATPAFVYLNYIAYYIRYDANAPLFRGTNQAFPLGPTNNWYWATYDSQLDTMAIFGEFNFDFTDNFRITAGGRWYRIEEDRVSRIGGLMQGSFPNLATDLVLSDVPAESAESGFLPKAGIEYRVSDDHLVYFTYSQGFRAGGGNTGRRDSIFANANRTYSSDILINHEFGTKTAWLDGRLQVNAAAYIMKWKDIQIQLEDPDPLLFQLGFVNFPQAKIKGFEVDFVYVPAESWDIGGSVSYNDAYISKTETFGAFQAVNGTPLPITPDWKAGLWLEYTFQTEFFGATPFARFDYSHTGESVNSLAGFEAIVGGVDPSEQDAYDIGDFRIGLDADTWNATFFIDNVWDERAEQFISNRWAVQRLSINSPRTFGLTFRKRFK